jgi:hypothetical protein
MPVRKSATKSTTLSFLSGATTKGPRLQPYQSQSRTRQVKLISLQQFTVMIIIILTILQVMEMEIRYSTPPYVFHAIYIL